MTSRNLNRAKRRRLRLLVQRSSARHGHCSVSRIFEDEFANLNADFLDPKLSEEMSRKIVGQRFNQFGRFASDKSDDFITRRSVIDRLRKRIVEVAKVPSRPESDVEHEPLPPRPLRFGHAD